MSGAGGNGEVGNERVFRFPASVRDITAVVILLGQSNAVQGLGNSADLVQFDQNRVRDFSVDRLL